LNSDLRSRPIRIAGAGPSGLSAAIALARAGFQVEVHEAKSDVGKRFIGDLQIIEGSSEREPVPDFLQRIGIEQNFYVRPADWATFFDAKGRGRAIHSDKPYGYFIHRGPMEGTLDRGLLAQAQKLGVDVRFNSRIDSSSADIAATGPASPDGLAKEIVFHSDHEELIDVYFNHKLSPGGYSYLFILDGIATFGCAIVADFKKIDTYFDHSWAEARKIRGLKQSDIGEVRTGYSYMNFHLKKQATIGESRLVGEAAGFQDYLFGLGIRYALTTGNLAARSIIENRSFDELWREQLEVKQRTSLVNRFLYEAGGNFGLSMFVRQAAKARDFHRYLSSWHQSTWWKRALTPFVQRHWKHSGRCLHKPGDHWCRARETEMRVPDLGPVDEQ
jgi:flavin-dependent dehydrogenase